MWPSRPRAELWRLSVYICLYVCVSLPPSMVVMVWILNPPRDSVGDFVLKGLLSGGRRTFERWGPMGDLYVIGLCP